MPAPTARAAPCQRWCQLYLLFAFPHLDLFFSQNRIRLCSALLEREGTGSASRALGRGQRGGHGISPPRCPPHPITSVPRGEDGSAPSTEPLRSPPHRSLRLWLGLNSRWKGESLILSFLATGIPPRGGG